jgi:hypothetical protein
MKRIECATEMAGKALQEAKRALAVAERTTILVNAVRKTGNARVMMPNGTAVNIEILYTNSRQQNEWNIYHTCRDWAVHSFRYFPGTIGDAEP